MKVIMFVDLLITLAAGVLGVLFWSKAKTAWRFVIVGAWLLLFGSISKNLALNGIIPDAGWGLAIADIPIIQVLYVCGSEFFILLGIWRAMRKEA